MSSQKPQRGISGSRPQACFGEETLGLGRGGGMQSPGRTSSEPGDLEPPWREQTATSHVPREPAWASITLQ